MQADDKQISRYSLNRLNERLHEIISYSTLMWQPTEEVLDELVLRLHTEC